MKVSLLNTGGINNTPLEYGAGINPDILDVLIKSSEIAASLIEESKNPDLEAANKAAIKYDMANTKFKNKYIKLTSNPNVAPLAPEQKKEDEEFVVLEKEDLKKEIMELKELIKSTTRELNT